MKGRCLLSVRERWDGEPWCEAGRALGRVAGAAWGDGGWLFCLLIVLCVTASALVKGHNEITVTLLSSAFCAPKLESVITSCKDIYPRNMETPRALVSRLSSSHKQLDGACSH